MSLEAFAVTIQTPIEVNLAGHSENHEVAFSVALFYDNLRPELSRLIVIGADIKQPLAVGRVGVHRNHRNSRLNGFIDFRGHELRIGRGNDDSCPVSCDCRSKSLHFCLRVITVWAGGMALPLPFVRSTPNTPRWTLPLRP